MHIIVVPQWFGSGSPDAHRLAEGGRRLAQALAVPGHDVLDLPTPTEIRSAPDAAGSGPGTIRHLAALTDARNRLTELLATIDGPPLLVGGECGIDWGGIGSRDRSQTAVVWFDAHPDLNTPESSPSGSFHGMVLRRLIDDGLPAARIVLAGTRSIDPQEADAIDEFAIPVVPVGQLAAGVVEALERIDPLDVWIHIDVDVLDPTEFRSLGFPEPAGAMLPELLEAIGAIRERWPLAGGAVTEFSPTAETAIEDLQTVLRIVDALDGSATAS